MTTNPPATATETGLAEAIYRRHERSIFVQTDRLFAGLLAVEWLAGMAAAHWITPLSWSGGVSRSHFHVSVAIYFGGLITLFPIALALLRPGHTYTRHVIALAQVAWSTLLIHFTGGRIETHFHVFASLVFLSFYRDWRVLVPADAVGARGAQRAVGHANGRNRIAIVVPCHRVINKNGALGGYGGEIWRKQALLRLERGERPLVPSAGASPRMLLR